MNFRLAELSRRFQDIIDHLTDKPFTWGQGDGTLSDQADLQEALDGKRAKSVLVNSSRSRYFEYMFSLSGASNSQVLTAFDFELSDPEIIRVEVDAVRSRAFGDSETLRAAKAVFLVAKSEDVEGINQLSYGYDEQSATLGGSGSAAPLNLGMNRSGNQLQVTGRTIQDDGTGRITGTVKILGVSGSSNTAQIENTTNKVD